jgi:lipopolysaccharide biosynthesis glycosyltransferase
MHLPLFVLLVASALHSFAVAMHLPQTFTTVDQQAHQDTSYTVDASGMASLLQEQPEHLDVVYSSDADGFVGLLTSMRSLAVNLKDSTKCTINVIVPKEDLEKAQELMTCFHTSLPGLAAQSKIPAVKLHELKPQPLINMSVAPEQVTKEHWFRPTAFAKLYIPEYLPNASRALWLDIDTLVQGDVSTLTSFPMKYSLAASLENAGLTKLLKAGLPIGYRTYADKINKNASNWFNPGVLLIDVQKYKMELRSQRVSNWFSILYGVQGDQLMLNFDYKDEFDVLDSRWNCDCLTAPFMVDAKQIPKAFILHWSCSGKKPWHEDKKAIRGVNDIWWDHYESHDKCAPTK